MRHKTYMKQPHHGCVCFSALLSMPAIDPSAASPLPDSVATLAPPDPSRRRILLAGASLAAAGLLSPSHALAVLPTRSRWGGGRRSVGRWLCDLDAAGTPPAGPGRTRWTARSGAGALAGGQRPADAHHRAPGRDRCQPRLGPCGARGADRSGGRSPYWYCFEALGARSQIGSARSLPAAHQMSDTARFGFVSCSHWELGYFSAYRHLAAEQPDLVFFLGDYIYEYSNQGAAANKVVRPHGSGECLDLAGYRNRYALYRTDPDLQALHAGSACVATWDDHEVQNDYANRWSQDPSIPVDTFLARRAAAYRAFTNISRCGPGIARMVPTCASTARWITASWRVSTCSMAASTAASNPARKPMAGAAGMWWPTVAASVPTRVAPCSVGSRSAGCRRLRTVAGALECHCAGSAGGTDAPIRSRWRRRPLDRRLGRLPGHARAHARCDCERACATPCSGAATSTRIGSPT